MYVLRLIKWTSFQYQDVTMIMTRKHVLELLQKVLCEVWRGSMKKNFEDVYKGSWRVNGTQLAAHYCNCGSEHKITMEGYYKW